ncbi:hypothetical protein BSL78_17233 [Apostichopus japonicus]|uniref:Acidic leucine-rich nuclear phosphoprotein 32 family member A n=1 Tax=Stichopus japonicus TaxID=307972 RepID=A0A2G8KD08_STIJA|nr:hypothetical protein BSL78_17233 [Apostichopus japonicus]
MEKRIELESRGMKADQIKDLILDNCRSGGTIEGLTSDFIKLEKLSMNGVCLTSLKNFPALVSLKKLELSDNRISSGLQHLTGCTNLKSLTLSNNNIKDFESLEPLKELKNLQTLDLFHCKVTSLDNYRDKVFQLLPHIKFLDGLDRNEQEDQESSGEEEDDVSENDDDDDDDEDDEEVGDDDADDGVVQINSDDSGRSKNELGFLQNPEYISYLSC